MDEYFRLATKVAIMPIQAYLTSKRNKQKDAEKRSLTHSYEVVKPVKVDPETGEILEVSDNENKDK